MMKEKSKNAAKTRREKEKVEFQELARLLPLPDAISGQLDKASVIRLATAFLRLRRLLLDNSDSPPSPINQQLNNGGRGSFMHQSTSIPPTPTMPQFHHAAKSLTDTSNTGFIQPKLPASTPPPCSTPFVDPTDGTQSTGKFNGSWQAGQQLAQSLDGFLLVVGADGKLIYVSEAASLHLGLSQVEMTGQPVGEYLHQDDNTELVSLINFYKSQLISVHNQQDFRIPVSVVLRMKCVLAKRNAGIVHGGMKVIHCVGYIRSIPPAPPVQPSTSNNNNWQHNMHPGAFNVMGAASPSPPTNSMPLSLGNGIFIEDRTNDDDRRTSSSAGSGGARVPSPHIPPCSSPPLPSFAPFAIFLVGISVPPASATELRLASSSLFMLRTTLDMKLLFVETPRVTELLGYEPQDLIEKNLYNLIHCDDLRTFRACHHLLLIKGQCVTSYFRVLTRDGGWVWVQSVQTIVSNSRSSRPHCIVSVNHVISQDQQIFTTSLYPAASFFPRRQPVASINLQTSNSNLAEACPPTPAGLMNDNQLNVSQRHHQLLVPAPRSIITAPTLVKPSPVQGVSAFQHPQSDLAESGSGSGFRLNSSSSFSTTKQALQVAPTDDSRSLVPSTWQQRCLVPSSTAFVDPMTSPFHQSRACYQNYHMGGFTSSTSTGGDFFSNDYSFFSKTAGMNPVGGVESYERLFSQQNNEFASSTGMTPMTPMTPSLLNTPAPTPAGSHRFGATPGASETGSSSNSNNCQTNNPSNGQANSLQIGGIHAHTINYTLHIENFNAHASSNAAAGNGVSTPTGSGTVSGAIQQQSTSDGSSLTIIGNNNANSEQSLNNGKKLQNGTLSASESVASAVASATAGLVLGGAPTTIVMCNNTNNNSSNNNNGNSNGTSQQQTSASSSCWFAEQQSMLTGQGQSGGSYFPTSAWQNAQAGQNQMSLQSRHNNLSSSNIVQQQQPSMMKTGHHPVSMTQLGGVGGLKRPFNGGNNYSSASSPFSSHNGLHNHQTAGVTSVIAMAPQQHGSNGVIEPLAKRLTTAPTPSSWLNSLQQQP